MWMKKVEAKERLWWVEDMATQNVTKCERDGRGDANCKAKCRSKKARAWEANVAQIASEMPTQKMKQEGDGVRTAALGRVWCRKMQRLFCEMG